ncbi:PAS domain S-box-containing protein [Silvibacterium bohemicum]|uniref:histidine kinase n=1 Tax=Silvibacterium bohemicum TaxID=1577686 RepID=A0A841JVL2_9BACT|nr:ATP-binding protein [Silvibacterium bohemicum]MBB6142478.1 PAS domain S-box-containing protein [Silvibacterium bohemicum]
MEKSFQIRITVVLLAVFTAAAAVLASLNFVQETGYQSPTDGVVWVEATGGLAAQRVAAGSAGQHAGLKAGDLMVRANDREVPRWAALAQEMIRTKAYNTITYTIMRDGVRIEVPVILDALDRSFNQGFRLIALVYLGIGLYVLFRRWTAPHSTHFYIFCLVSFVLYSFKSTGKMDGLDQAVYWGNILAESLQPALFLHFALAFADERGRRRPRLMSLVYLPGIFVIGLRLMAIWRWSATELLRHRLDQIGIGYDAAFYVLAAVVLFVSYKMTTAPLRRQQLKWLTRGTIVAVMPFALLYAIPYLFNFAVPDLVTKLAGISLVFLPLTFSWAIVRYRLMDTDLIFKRGVTYTLATASLVGLYFLLVAISAEVVRKRLPNAGAWGVIAAIVITAQLFDPLKRRIQDRVDRVFDRKRYDYRQTLIEFGRGLNSQTDLNALLNAIVDRLPRTLLVTRIAVFLADQQRGGFVLAAGHGLPPSAFDPKLDLGLLDFDQPDAGSHIFLENPQQALHLTEPERRAASLLDLNYYLPCRVQDRAIAVIGLGRTADGDFLSSEDVELLESLASYIGIAIQNARLYASLEEKISEYERLKEFNENIVESINVGILAVDLEDRIDSWNSQMEVMYALPRAEALRQPLSAVFPPGLIEAYERATSESGVHNLYKFRLETRTGEVRTANIAIAPLVSRDFTTVGRIILVDDITDRTELEVQLSQAEKLSSIGLLAAGVAHEVNTPLAVISSYTQMLTKQVRGDDRLSPLLEKITQQTFRASEIVNGLLNFSRTGTTEFRETDLNAIIRDTLTLVEHQFKTSQVQLDATLLPDLPPILGNAGKLQQVFLNLFLNAKDAMTDGGTLRIATEVNGHVSVAISDTGSGISPEHLRRIYDPFFTTKSAPKEGQRRGTGLGLAVTYGIIQEHAGKIHVESQVGEGTTFYLEFPMLRKAAHV